MLDIKIKTSNDRIEALNCFINGTRDVCVIDGKVFKIDKDYSHFILYIVTYDSSSYDMKIEEEHRYNHEEWGRFKREINKKISDFDKSLIMTEDEIIHKRYIDNVLKGVKASMRILENNPINTDMPPEYEFYIKINSLYTAIVANYNNNENELYSKIASDKNIQLLHMFNMTAHHIRFICKSTRLIHYLDYNLK